MSSVVCVVQLKLSKHFFYSNFASFVWNTVYITSGIQPIVFGSWLHGLRSKIKNQILLGAAELCGRYSLNRNDMIFNKAKSNIVIQVIFRAIYWIRQWSMLHTEVETLLFAIFAKFGWEFRNRIEA